LQYACVFNAVLLARHFLLLQALASIITTASAKLLPEKQMNEAALAVKNTLFAAAAAHSYRQQQVRISGLASSWAHLVLATCMM
jgi:hypothetical protein